MDDSIALRRDALANARRVVIKVGSRLLTESPAGRPAIIADEIAHLRGTKNIDFVVVSSGAISLGMSPLGLSKRPTELPALQAAAAVGQGRLVQAWERAFAAHEMTIGQVLLSHDDISNRKRFLNARRALRSLLDFKVVPIVNENDTVAVEEIKYGDNDLLAAMVCNLVSADVLLILTDVDGLRDAEGKRIPIVRDIAREAEPVARGTTRGGIGSGGMSSKVQAARVACDRGVATAVIPGRNPGVIGSVLGGADVGTLFLPPSPRMSSRKHWLAYGLRPAGRLVVDEGAQRALEKQGKSLLPAGIVSVEGDFDLGDLVSVVTASGTEFARGLAGYRAVDMRQIQGTQSSDIEATLGYKYLDEAIHRDDLVLL